MYIAINEEIAPQNFIVCEFYGVQTCFCWDANKLVLFPYSANDSSVDNVRILLTPAPVKQIQCFSGRIFVICMPQGIYKLSRNYAFALLSKNALGIGAEFCEVFIAKRDSIYLDNKQTKSSKLLFPVASNVNKDIHSCPLIFEDMESNFLKCLTDNWKVKKNLCLIGYGKKLFTLIGDTLQIVYTSDTGPILNIISVKKGNKISGLLLLINLDVVILIYVKDHKLISEKVYLGRKIRSTSVLCASFSLQLEHILWIIYCDHSQLYYVKKELFADVVQEAQVEKKIFVCIQHYQPNVILALSKEKELTVLSLETMENSLLISNNINLHANMFQKTDLIMAKIHKNVKELDVLYEKLADKQDRLRRINLYAHKWKLQINPCIQVSRLWNHHYLTLSIPEKLPKNSYMVFTFVSKNQNTFCMKKVIETPFKLKMSINENEILHSSTINMDLITLVNREGPWCLIRNFINSPLQKEMRKRGQKKDKTAFINTKIASLQNLIVEKDLDMTKLCEIKNIIRTEL